MKPFQFLLWLISDHWSHCIAMLSVSITCVDSLVVYQHCSLSKFLSTVSTLLLLEGKSLSVSEYEGRKSIKFEMTYLHSRACLPMCSQIWGVPEEFSTDVTVELPLRLMAEHVLIQAPPPPSLKLLPTNLKNKVKEEMRLKITSQVRKGVKFSIFWWTSSFDWCRFQLYSDLKVRSQRLKWNTLLIAVWNPTTSFLYFHHWKEQCWCQMVNLHW